MKISKRNLGLVTRLHFFVTRVEEDIILLLWIVKFVSLGPVVADRVGEDLTITIETTSSNRLLHLLRSLELRPGVFIPERKSTIGTCCGQCAVHRVKFDVIHCVNVLIGLIGSIGTMTLKGKIILWKKIS